jgi:hypothetical protein
MSDGIVGHQLLAFNSSVITMSGGTVVNNLRVFDSSTITMSGGTVANTLAWESSTVTMSGGTVRGHLLARDSSAITMSGGTVGGDLLAYHSSIITISGIDFMVDGTPVPFGDLSALTGTLTGTLTNGGNLDNDFYQGGYAATYTGIIRLVTEPSAAVPALQRTGRFGLASALGLVGIAAVRRRRAN